jgi:UDP-N-acetylmuramyl pentapeptide phosphotransferase/UDP-N-acetylglucosamine-1-phosphate transferase
VAILVLVASCVAAAVLCALLIPFFRAAFLATPGARSSHATATPQGGGLVVIPVAIAAAFALAESGELKPDPFAWCLIAALLLLMAVGAWDDRASLNPGLRLVVQFGAAALALGATPYDFGGLTGPLPPLLVAGCLLVGMTYFINLTNFMDGIDLMSVTQFAPAFATIYLLLMGYAGPAQWVGPFCLAGAGALLGFALLNKPRARLFLGDAGSLPLGLLGATALLVAGGARGPAAAILPFLYYIADASLTLARRILAGERFWQAHRDHFYQRAIRRGLSTWQVIARVGACNVFLCIVALLVAGRPLSTQVMALALGVASVAFMMRDLVRERR